MLPVEFGAAWRGFTVQHQVDPALVLTGDVLGRMVARRYKSELLELRCHCIPIGRRELDEFEAVGPERIQDLINHFCDLPFPGCGTRVQLAQDQLFVGNHPDKRTENTG